jgi:beta-lactamase regulating signal transducer with metallopeptidase domain
MPILLNWIWQGSALTLLVALVVCRRRAVNAATRERIWWATLGAVCLMPFVSMLGVTPTTGVAVTHDSVPLAVVAEPSGVVVGLAWLIWASWFTISVVRLVSALVALRRARRFAAPFPSERLDGLPAWTRVSSEGRRATLAVSDDVRTAAVLGLGRPLIAVSPGTLDQLTDDELDGILVHEYGHVQRRDDLGVLLQRAVHALFGLHPAVWWLDRALTFEREVACDDLVLAQDFSSPQRYARSLVRLVQFDGPPGGLRLAPGAIVSRPQLSRRIVRLLDRGRNASVKPSRSMLGFAAVAIACGAVATLSVELIAMASGAPILASRRLAARWVVPFASVPDTGGPAHAWASAGIGGQRRPTQPAGPQDPGRAEATAAASLDSAVAKTLPAEPLDIVAVFTPASESTSLASPDWATDVDSTNTRAHAPPDALTPWSAAANAASAISRGSRKGAIKTAGFFTRISRSVAGAF